MHEPLGLGPGGVERDPPDDVDRDLHPGGLLADDLHVLRRVPGRGARTLDPVRVVRHREEDVVGVGEPAPREPRPEPRIGPDQPVGRGHDRAERVAGAGGAPDRGRHPEQAGGPQARPADLRRLDVERERIEPVPATGLEPDRPDGPMQVEREVTEPRQVPRDHLDPPPVRGVDDRLHAVAGARTAGCGCSSSSAGRSSGCRARTSTAPRAPGAPRPRCRRCRSRSRAPRTASWPDAAPIRRHRGGGALRGGSREGATGRPPRRVQRLGPGPIRRTGLPARRTDDLRRAHARGERQQTEQRAGARDRRPHAPIPPAASCPG